MAAPLPSSKFVLRSWKDDGKPTDHDVNFQDVRVRSSPAASAVPLVSREAPMEPVI